MLVLVPSRVLQLFSHNSGVDTSPSQDLREKTRQMAVVIEQSNLAYEQRDKAQLEIAAIEQANRREEDAYHQQVNDLSDELERMNEQLFNYTKRNQQPVLVDLAEEERKSTERKEASRANEIARVEEEYAQQRKERMQNFEEVFRKISAATGISDVDELVRVFIENEEHNFSLFRYLNDQASELERLEEEIQALHEEGSRYSEAAGDDSDEYNEEMLKLESKIKATEEQTATYKAKCESHQKILDEVKDEVKLLLIRLDCKCNDQDGETSITTDNVLDFLGLIEEKTIEIISKYRKMKDLSDYTEENPAGYTPNGPSFSGALNLVAINPPRFLDYSSDESAEDGGELMPVHRESINYSKVEARASMMRRNPSKRKTVNGRRGSMVFNSRTSQRGGRNGATFMPELSKEP